MNTSGLTVENTLFTKNPDIFFWCFEVVYQFQSLISTSALNFEINRGPENGSCSIDPPNGTTSTLFTINCTGWLDKDDIKDYSFYCKNIIY